MAQGIQFAADMEQELGDLPSIVECDDDLPCEFEYSPDEVPPAPALVPTLYYDPTRFPTAAALARLKWDAFNRSPNEERQAWEIRELSPADLRYASPFSDGRTEQRFVARGYVTNRENLKPSRGTPPAMAAEQGSLSALQRSVVIGVAVIDAIKKIMGREAPAWLLPKTKDVLAPMVGRCPILVCNGIRKNDTTHTHDAHLIIQDNLLFGCVDFRFERKVIPSGYYEFDTLLAAGRGVLHEQQRDQNDVMLRLITEELRAIDHAHLPGVALWACQRVAHCRIAAEEARWYFSRARRQAIETRYIKTTLRNALDKGFRKFTRTKNVVPLQDPPNAILLRSPWLHLMENTRQAEGVSEETYAEKIDISALDSAFKEADLNINLAITKSCDNSEPKPPNIYRLPLTLRRSIELAFLGSWVAPLDDHLDDPRGDLQEVADWLSELRRWGCGVFDAYLASILDRVLRGSVWEEYDRAFGSVDGRAAIDFLLTLMPTEFWAKVEAALDGVLAGGSPVPILYDYGNIRNRTRRADVPAELSQPILSQGPFLAFPRQDAALWAERSAKLGPYGLLVRPKNMQLVR